MDNKYKNLASKMQKAREIERQNYRLADQMEKENKPLNYIKINGKKIEDLIIENAEKMLNLTGEIDPANIVSKDIVDLNLLSLYDNNNNLISYDLEGVRKGKDYWEKQADEYIKILKEKLKQDLSSTSKDELRELIGQHNKQFLTLYMAGIKANALDLADDNTRIGYANRLANSIADLQIQEINKVGAKEFFTLDLTEKPYKMIYYIDVDKLSEVQKIANRELDDIDSYYAKTYPKEKYTIKFTKDRAEVGLQIISDDIKSIALADQIKKVDKIYEDDKDFYDKRHKKRKEIDKLLDKIADKYKELNDYYNTPRVRAIDTDSDNIVEEMQRQDKNLDKAKFNTTLLSNKLFTGKDLESGIPYEFKFKENTTREDITTSITIYDSKSNIIKLSKEHRDINDAVGSLLDNGIRYLTLKQLYNFINKGIISNDPVDQDKLDDLLKDLYKMDRKADIDATEQFNLKGYREYLQEYEKKTGIKARPIISQNLINFKILKNIPLPNGEQIDIICFMDYPAIYDYARQYRQLAPYPVEILNLNYSPKNNSKNNTIQINEITRTIRNELIRCIELRKSGINQPLVINNFLCNECQFYDVIDKDIIDKNKIHTKVINKQKRIRYTNNIETILNNFKDKGYIKDYKIHKAGKVNKYSIQFIF